MARAGQTEHKCAINIVYMCWAVSYSSQQVMAFRLGLQSDETAINKTPEYNPKGRE